jgi:hypothetical protein
MPPQERGNVGMGPRGVRTDSPDCPIAVGQDAVLETEGLNGMFLFQARHCRMSGKIQEQRDHIGRFSFKIGIVGDHVPLEAIVSMDQCGSLGGESPGNRERPGVRYPTQPGW